MAKSNNIFFWALRHSNEYVNKRLKSMGLALLWIHEIKKRSKLSKNGMHPYILTAKLNNIFFLRNSNEWYFKSHDDLQLW